MAHEIDFPLACMIPEIDIQDKHAVINVTTERIRDLKLFKF